MAFRVEVRNSQNNKTITFGPRTPGQVGKDILAIKIALGIIKRVLPESSILGNSGFIINDENLPSSADVPMNRQDWFNCQTGLGTDLKTASTFDLHMENVLKKFQIDNSFLILSYFFEKRGIKNILADVGAYESVDSEEYKNSVIAQISLVLPLFEVEFGQLGEATLAIMHGWRPHTTMGNTGFVHSRSIYRSKKTPVIDIVPKAFVDTFFRTSENSSAGFSSSMSYFMEQGYVHSRHPTDPTIIRDDNGDLLAPSWGGANSLKLKQYKRESKSSNNWILGDDNNLSVPFSYYYIDYKPIWENSSRLIEPARVIMDSTPDFSESSLLDSKTKENRIKSFFYPDPFSTENPFVIDDKTLGIFYETDFEIKATNLPSQSPETISSLEDKALSKVIDFYKKPKIWNFLVGDRLLSSTYQITIEDSPNHSGSFPLQMDEERVRNSSVFRAIELRVRLLEKRLERLSEQMTPSASNRHRDMEVLSEQIQTKIDETNSEIQELLQRKRRLLSGEELRKKDFWVVTTDDVLEKLVEGTAQSWRTLEKETADPLIKFIEFRTPPMRPGMKYRALMLIDREKLDLIMYGDNLPETFSTLPQDTSAENDDSNEDLVRVCPNQSTSEAKRSYQEMVSHAKKRRRELARSLKEITNQRDTEGTVPQIDLGQFGPYNFNQAFAGLHGLSGITNEYEYTKKAIKLLVDSGSTVLESLGISDTLAEDLEEAINEGTAKSESGDRDSLRYNQIIMPWPELKERIKTACDDLSEAETIIDRENIQFVRGSNYKPAAEVQLLRAVESQIDEIVGDQQLDVSTMVSQRPTISGFADQYDESEIIVCINFAPLDYSGLGFKNGKRIKDLTILVQEKNFFNFDSGVPNTVFRVSFSGQNAGVLKEYESLSRPRTVNYLSYIGAMTNPYPSSFGSFIKSFWDDGRSVCKELGIDSDKGLAISLVGNYTSGIQIDFSKDKDGLVEAFKDWSKKNFVNPTSKWLDQSGRNLSESIADTFDEEAALDSFGKLCTLEDLYKEFLDKLDLKSLLCDYLKCLKLPAFEFKLPTFYLPPFPKIPIIGWYGYLVYFLVKQIREILIRILCTFVRTIIDKLSIPFCEEQLQDFISAGSSATPVMNRALAESLTNTGITSGNEQKAKEFFDDVANLTTGQELCRLLEGKPLDAAAMQMLHRLAEKQGLNLDLDSDEAIINYFGVVGAFVPFDVCDKLASLPGSDSLTAPLGTGSDAKEKCDDLLEQLAAIRNRLISGDDSITDEEIKEVVDLAKKNLEDKKAEIDALSGANFDVLLPPSFKPGTQENQDKVVSSMPGFLGKVMQQGADNLFIGAKSSYISGLSSYVSSMRIRTPSTPSAFDQDYDADTNLRLEAALEQVKNYTQLLDTSGPQTGQASGEVASELANDLGLFEDAENYGLGIWDDPRTWNGNENYLFLDPSRDLDNPGIREQNQEMIKELLKREFLNTLKIKQIISAFTIFENFGHDPLAAYMKYSRELKTALDLDLSGDPHGTETQNDPTGQLTKSKISEYNLEEWWRVRPSGVGKLAGGGTLESAYSLIDEIVASKSEKDFNPNKKSHLRHGTENALRNFTLVTHTLYELPWYKNWIGDQHNNASASVISSTERLTTIFSSIAPEDQAKKRSIISKILSQLEKLHPFADLEIFCETDPSRSKLNRPIFAEDNPLAEQEKTYSKELRNLRQFSLFLKDPSHSTGPYPLDQNYGFDKKLDDFLSEIVNNFYPEENQVQNFSSIYGGISEDSFDPPLTNGYKSRRGFFHHGPKGNPLFLVNDKNGRDFIPIKGFGSGLMYDRNEFVSAIDGKHNKGYDIYLPILQPEDFILSNPVLPSERASSFTNRPITNSGWPIQTRRADIGSGLNYYVDYTGMSKIFNKHYDDPELSADDRTLQYIDDKVLKPIFDGADTEYPAVDNYVDLYPHSGADGQSIQTARRTFYDNAFNIPLLAFREREAGQRHPSHRRFQLGINTIPANCMHAIITQNSTDAHFDFSKFRFVVGHPFHQRLGYGFEDVNQAQIGDLEHNYDNRYSLLSYAKYMDPQLYGTGGSMDDITRTGNNRSFYEYCIYGQENNLYNNLHFHVFDQREEDFPSQRAGSLRGFLNSKSEFAALNRRSFIYRMHPNNKNSDKRHKGGLGDEYDNIPRGNSWDPLGYRLRVPNYAPYVFDRVSTLGDFNLEGRNFKDRDKQAPYFSDYLNPINYHYSWSGDEAEIRLDNDSSKPLSARYPNIGAKEFFMLPNRILQMTPGHWTRTGYRGDGKKGPMTFDSEDGTPADYKSDMDKMGRLCVTQDEIEQPNGSQMLKRESFLKFIKDRRFLMNEQLYMKIVKLTSHLQLNDDNSSIRIPFVNKFLLSTIMMSVLEKRIQTLENAMIIYGTKNDGSLVSIFEDVEMAAPFLGFSNPAAVEITPEKVKTLFTPFETETINGNLVHKRYYDDDVGNRRKIEYEDFIQLLEDPLGTKWPRDNSGRKVEFYLLPYKVGAPEENFAQADRSDLQIQTRDFNMSYENASGDRIEINDVLPKNSLGEKFETEFISKDLFYLKNMDNQRFKSIAKDSFIRTSKMLLLDDDQDNLIELAQLSDGASGAAVRLAYTNSPALLDIASERIESLTGMILEIIQNTNQTYEFKLLPTLSDIFKLIRKTHYTVGQQLNLVYERDPNRNNVPSNIGLRFGIEPYTPGVKMVELPLRGTFDSDRFNIVVDSDINLGLSFKKEMALYSQNPDRNNPNLMIEETEENKKFRKIFSFCEKLPESLISKVRESTLSQASENQKVEARRVIFSDLVKQKLDSISFFRNMGIGDIQKVSKSLQTQVFDEVVSNLMGEMMYDLENSPMFSEEYAEQVEARTSGRPVVTETENGRCVSNRYSLDSGSVLSFKKVIIGDAFKEVMAEMSKPENSPFNRDFGKPEPFDKAMKTISVKAFIRLCLVDLMLKGAFAYSIWDMEPIIASPVFIEYAKEHVKRELEKSKNLKSIWGRTLERSENIQNKIAALEFVITEEIIKFPQFSKQIFHPNTSGKDFYNWYAYGKTLFETDVFFRPDSQNKFFNKFGAIPRIPVSKIDRDTGRGVGRLDRVIFASKSHMNNDLVGDVEIVEGVSGMRSGIIEDRINPAFSSFRKYANIPDTTIRISEAPTAKLIYEDYYRCSGRILEFFDVSQGPGEIEDDELDMSHVINYEEMEAVLASLRNSATENYAEVLENSEIKIGQRLVLVLNNGDLTNIDTGPGRNAATFDPINIIVEQMHHNSLDAVSRRERAYRVISPNGSPATTSAGSGQTVRPFLATIPLTSFERELSLEECNLISSFFESRPLSPRNEANVPSEFYLSISKSFSQTDGFKHYLDHIFPVRRYMAVSTIFSSSVLGGFNDVPSILDSAKVMVSFVGMICSVPPDQRDDLITIDQADWSKMMREQSPGDMNEGECFDFPGISGQFFKEFFKELLKIMKYFPSILFRGIANILDPAYKEMRSHYMNCDLKSLAWSGVAGKTVGKKLVNGRRDDKYAAIIPSAPIDYFIGFQALKYYQFRPLLESILKTVAYIYSGQLPFLDLSAAFKVPCMDLDKNWKKGEKYDAGAFGRYGHPISPFTVLALSTLQLPADKDRKNSNCVSIESGGEEQLIPDEDCEEQNLDENSLPTDGEGLSQENEE